MTLSRIIKKIARKLAVTLYGTLELVGLPRLPKRPDRNRGGER